MERLESKNIVFGCQVLVGIFFALLSAWQVINNANLPALVYFCGFVLLAAKTLDFHQNIILAAFACYTLASLLLLMQPEHYLSPTQLSLHLAFPFIAFSLLSFHKALFFVLGMALAINLLAMLYLEGIFRASFLTIFWLSTLLSSTHSFSHQLHQKSLHQFLSRNPKSGFFNGRQLIKDFKKEHERAKREATYLALFSLEKAASQEKGWTPRELESLNAAFEPFERIYHVSASQMLVLLPLGSSAQVQPRLKELKASLSGVQLQVLPLQGDTLPDTLLQQLEEHAGAKYS